MLTHMRADCRISIENEQVPAAAAGMGEAPHGSGHDRRGGHNSRELSGRLTDEFGGNRAEATASLLSDGTNNNF